MAQTTKPRAKRAPAQAAPVDNAALRASMLDKVLDTLAAQPTHAARAKLLGYTPEGAKGFRDNVRATGTYVNGSRGADNATVTVATMRAVYDQRPSVAKRIDALIDAALAAPSE